MNEDAFIPGPTRPAALIQSLVPKRHRILVVDDNAAIHEDFRKILSVDEAEASFASEEAEMFGGEARSESAHFDLKFALQGEEAVENVRQAFAAACRYALVFLDIRMPPGLDGIETAVKLWEIDPDLQVVICTAFSDYSWREMAARLGNLERVLVLKKPFETVEILQLAHALTEKWELLQAIRNQNGQLEQLVAERTHDLTLANEDLARETAAHKLAADRIREQATLIEKAHDAIVVTNLEGEIQFWNHSAEELYGWSGPEALGKTFSVVFPAVDAEATRLRAKLMKDDSCSAEISGITKAGRTVTISSHWTLIRDEGGQPKSILAIQTDDTERKQLESQFMRAQRLEGIGALASGIAHDLNNLISPIVLGIGLLKDKLESTADRSVATMVEASALRATGIIKQVLLFAKGEASCRIELQPQHIVREVAKIAMETFPKSIQMKLTAAEDSWHIQADPTQMHQVLLNLCVNARDAMPNGGEIAIATRNVHIDESFAATVCGLKPGPHVVISVADTGTGIPDELLDKIFEPFFTTKDLNGTGLGLSTAFGIVKGCGGAITVKSQLAVGSTFSLYFPAAECDSDLGEELERVEVPLGDGQLILVVDDEPLVLKTTSRALESFGYRILQAANGIEAIALAAKHLKDLRLVLTDMMMPLLDGAGTIRAIRRLSPDLPIIGTSGGSLRKQALDMVELGADLFIAKPVTGAELAGAVYDALTRARTRIPTRYQTMGQDGLAANGLGYRPSIQPGIEITQ